MNVTSITYAPVKGLGLVHVDEVELELTGVRENRRFHLIDDDGRLINGKFAGTLVQVAATADRDAESLSLRFPDGSVEAACEGADDAVESMVDWCRHGPRGARVDDLDVSWEQPTGEQGFAVR